MNDATPNQTTTPAAAGSLNINLGGAAQALDGPNGLDGRNGLSAALAAIDPAQLAAVFASFYKAGWKSWESWMALLMVLGPMLLTWCGTLHGDTGVWLSAVVTIAYQVARNWHKSDAAKNAIGVIGQTLTKAACIGIAGLMIFGLSGCQNGRYVGPSIGLSGGYQGVTVGVTLYGENPVTSGTHALTSGSLAALVPLTLSSK